MVKFLSLFFFLTQIETALIPQLGDKSFRKREAAQQVIGSAGDIARSALEHNEFHEDPEIARRVQTLLLPWEEERIEIRASKIYPSDYPVLPWIGDDMGENPIAAYYLTKARNALGISREPTFKEMKWPEYREATRLWLIGQVSQRNRVEDIVRQLDRWVEEERQWIRDNGKNFQPQLRPADWKEDKE